MRLDHPSSDGWWATDAEADALCQAGEWIGAGFLRGAGVSVPMRHARAVECYLAHCPLRPYSGELLYPCGGGIWTTTNGAEPAIHMWALYVAFDAGMDTEQAAARKEAATDPIARAAFAKLEEFCRTYPRGGGYTHSIVNFGRVLGEGLDSYRARIEARLAAVPEGEAAELYRALLVTLDAVETYRARIAEYLGGLTFADQAAERNRKRLADAYASGLPSRPARGFFDAMVATTFLYAIDGSDNLGRFDQFMLPYYEESLASGDVTRDEARELIRTLWRYVDDCTGWNVALGGSTREGAGAASDLTVLCLDAAQRMRRPNLALRLREDTPDAVWDAAIDTIATGAGLPALYCEENYLAAIDEAHLNLPDDDKRDFAFGGCTELMIHGRSCVGSLDADFSVIKPLEETLHRCLADCATFDDLLAAYEADLRRRIYDLTEAINRNQEIRAAYHPQLIRTLLIDDCIDRGRGYYDGGARYNWSIVSIVGLSNVIDSLAAVRQAVYEDRFVTADALLAALKSDFEGAEGLRTKLEHCRRFGNDDPDVNALAARLSGFVYREFKRYAPWRGGRFLCGTLLFVTYGYLGKPVGATPDGRLAGTPVGDSAGPVQGRDHHGPTAMLRSVASLAQADAPGTLVVNLRLAKSMFGTPEMRERVKALVRGYFALGGMQLQVNVVDQAVLRDAIEHPERHADLIVRVGGYSEYFNRLDMDLKLSILERTEHA